MDFVPLIDAVGEPMTALIGGAALGLIFGIAAQRSGFCTRSAVIQAARHGDYRAFAIWMAGFATAVLLVQWMIYAGDLAVAETRFFSTAQSLSGALIGGLLFGVGMALARGCVSRLTVLAASGNLRSVFSLLIVALAGWATFAGVLIPMRDSVAGLSSTASIGGNELLAQLSASRVVGLAIGLVLAVLAVVVTVRSKASIWRVIGGVVVGLTVAGGWLFTWQLSQQVFDPIQVESLSFIRPYATTLMLAIGALDTVSMDQGLLIGVLVGGAIAALMSGDFRIAKFGEPGVPSIWRYGLGSALMGFGGILAVGCTVGAGLTGGSVLAVSSLIALVSMAVGAAVTDRVVDAAPKA
jgi:uncharacterized membrane protein YedE/YeeE